MSSDQSASSDQEAKPISHHHNHRLEKPNKSQAQRGRKLQFEDFEWYEHSKHENKSEDVPGRVEGRRLPKRLSETERRYNRLNTQGNSQEDMDDFTMSSLPSRPPRRPRRIPGYRPRSSLYVGLQSPHQP